MIADGADRLPAGGCSPCKGRGSPWQCNHHIKKVKLEEDGEGHEEDDEDHEEEDEDHIKKVKLEEDGEGEDLVEREEEKGGDDKKADGVHYS